MLQDFRGAIRLLVKNPAFSGVAVLVLALGIGANTAVFSLVNALLFQPTATEEPGIVGIFSRDRTRPNVYRGFSWAAFEEMRASREPFDALMAYTMTMVGTTEREETRRSFAAIVSADYFSTIGVQLAAGRTFTADEGRPESDQRVVIVGHQQARKAGVPPSELLDKTVRLNARDYTIVGVAPEGFSGTTALVAPEYWLPLGVFAKVTDEMIRGSESVRLSDPANHSLMLVARLKAGVAPEAATPLIANLSERFRQIDQAQNKDFELQISRLSRVSISTRPQDDSELSVMSLLLMGTASLVLLISSLNLANMMLARGTARRKEIALRLALGSGRARVMRQLLIENLVLAAIGSALGLLIASWSASLLVASLASVMPFVLTIDAHPDIRVLLATMAFGAMSTIIAGLGPAFRATRLDVLPDLKEQPAETVGGRRFSMRNVLVVGQVALSLALLTAAGLFMRGAGKAGAADPGFPLAGGIVVNVDPGMAGYDETHGRLTLERVLQRLRATPGVQAASVASLVPFGEFQESQLVQKIGTPAAAAGQEEQGVDSTFTIVGADYFDALRLPLLRGRGFTAAEEESATGTRVAVIDEPLARRLFGNDDPVGQPIQFRHRGGKPDEPFLVVGLVAGVRHDLFDKVPVPHVYVASGQNYRGNVNLHVRLAGGTAEGAMVTAVRQAIYATDNLIPILQIRTLAEQRDKSLMLWAVNASAQLFSIFGAVALLLAVIGVYGVKSYLVSRRTREIGIRMALGASPSNVLWLVLREGIGLTATGIGIGLLLSWGVARALSSLLYEVSAVDPIVFSSAAVVLTLSAMAACYLPARRATHVLPTTALRSE